MLRTSDSTPIAPDNVFAMTRVCINDPVTVSTHAEIELMTSSYTLACDFHHHIADSIGPRLDDTELKRLLSLIYALPSRYDMLDRSWHWHPATPTRHYYRSIYTLNADCTARFVEQRHWSARCTRSVIFKNVVALLAFLKQYTRAFRAHLTEEHNRFIYDMKYALALSSFEAWMDLAGPFVCPSLSRLRSIELYGI
jgi:hypothetical protein